MDQGTSRSRVTVVGNVVVNLNHNGKTWDRNEKSLEKKEGLCLSE